MRGGKLRERLTLQSATATQGATGAVTEAFSTLATVWGRVQFLEGRELRDAQAINEETSVRFTIRRRTDVTPQHRVTWDSRTWLIVAVMQDEMKTRTTLLAREIL